MPPSAELLPGTLDLLILKAVSLGRLHGYGVLLRIEQISRGAILVQQGALYPALYRLEQRGLLETEWGTSTTIDARSSTGSPPPDESSFAKKRSAGIASSRESRPP